MYELGPSRGQGQNMGCTAGTWGAPRDTTAAGATLKEAGTSVAATAAPKPAPGRTIQEALAQTPQQQGLGWTSL